MRKIEGGAGVSQAAEPARHECRSLRGSSLKMGFFSNRWIFVGVGAILVLQLGFVYLPFMNVLFGSAPLGLAEWGQSLLVGALVLPVVWLEKALRERRHRRDMDREGREASDLENRRRAANIRSPVT